MPRRCCRQRLRLRRLGGRGITPHWNGPSGPNGPLDSKDGRAPGRPFNADPLGQVTTSPVVRQIPESAFSGPPLTEGASLFRTPDTVTIGETIQWECYDDDGLGPAKTAVFQTADGVLFALEHHELSPRRDLMTVFVRPDDIATYVDSVLVALGYTSSDLGWLPPTVSLRPARIIRQDDNGVQFRVGDFPCRADAEAAIARLAAGGHKQAYFIESIQDGGPRLKFPDDFGSPPTTLPA